MPATFIIIVLFVECMSYHVAFLGRNSTQPNGLHVYGQLQYQGIEYPRVIDGTNCTWTNDSIENDIKMINATVGCEKLIPKGFQLSSTGFKVESSSSFTLHVYQSDSAGELADGYLAIPDEHLGTSYLVPTYCSLGGYCQIAVAGTTDGTSVNIVLPNHIEQGSIICNGKSINPGESIPFKLDENDVLHIESTEARVDLSGTYITADKVVAVFTGTRDIPHGSSMIEQIPPTTKWGTELVVAPIYLSEAGDVIKIIAKSADTTVHILGYSLFTISKAGEWKEVRIDWQMHSTIRATKPILVLQVMSLNLYNDTSIVPGNPATVLVPHIEQWTNKSIWSNCFQRAGNKSIVTSVASSHQETLFGPDTITEIEEIEASNEYYIIQSITNGDTSGEKHIAAFDPGRSIYGYCDGKSAVLLEADWSWNNEVFPFLWHRLILIFK